MVDKIDFVRFLFSVFFSFWDHFDSFWALLDIFFWSGWNLRSFLGFTWIDNFHFFCFLTFWGFQFFRVIFSLFELYLAIFGVEMGSESFFGLNSYRQITFFLQDFVVFWLLIFCFFGSFWGFWGAIGFFGGWGEAREDFWGLFFKTNNFYFVRFFVFWLFFCFWGSFWAFLGSTGIF